jgi:hypothetical protein
MIYNSRIGNGFHVSGSAHLDYTIALSLAGVVFCTGDLWIMPLMMRCIPAFGAWLVALPHWVRLTVCGGIALMTVTLLVLALMRIKWQKPD